MPPRERRQRGPHDPGRAQQVDADGLLPGVGVGVQRASGRRAARVENEDVDRPERLRDTARQRRHRVLQGVVPRRLLDGAPQAARRQPSQRPP